MDFTTEKPQASNGKTQHPARTQPVRLPEATANLVNRMLAARCGSSH